MVVYVFPKFRQNLRSSAIFRVDLAWNYPYAFAPTFTHPITTLLYAVCRVSINGNRETKGCQ